ncbi:hypothetical protein D9756_002579 [Leucocoprinus leucothites]|uniref:DUF6534 domain-containing protein n=1 Tax=Leucocoprinus leucothites TaxID=201217 RepID=A0A8H5GBN2_9AGAR|nr:hypothetical protein D9756_002579 [Leucoagaricus leucothites]
MAPVYINLSSSYGVLLIGVLFATFFQGVLTVQVYQYYQDFPEDPRATRILVAILWTLDFIHLVLISYTIYYYLVTSWGNTGGIMHLVLPFCFHLFPIAFTTLFSQLFFLYRIWVFSQRNAWIVGPIFICSLGYFSLIFASGVMSTTVAGFPQGLMPMVIIGVTTDLSIAALLCYYLRRRSEATRGMRLTSTLVSQVIRYTVATGAITSLNARRRFRETLESMEPSFPKTAAFGGTSSAIQRMTRAGGTSTNEHSSRFPTTASRSVTGENRVRPRVQRKVIRTEQPIV